MVRTTRLPRAGGPAGSAVALACLGLLVVGGCSGGSPHTASSGASSAAPSGTAAPSAGRSSSAPAAPSPDATSSGGSSARPRAPKAVAVPTRIAHQARQRTEGYVDTVTSVLTDPRRATSKRASTGPVIASALAQLVNQAGEYAANGWRVTGRPRVLSTTVVGRTKSPPTLTVDVCVDNSDVKVVDRSGTVVPGPSSPARSRNLLTLVPRGGSWAISDQGFPDDPDC